MFQLISNLLPLGSLEELHVGRRLCQNSCCLSGLRHARGAQGETRRRGCAFFAAPSWLSTLPNLQLLNNEKLKKKIFNVKYPYISHCSDKPGIINFYDKSDSKYY